MADRDIGLLACHRVLYQRKGQLETAWNFLAPQFRAILPSQARVRIDPVVQPGGIVATLHADAGDVAERERGGTVPVVPLIRPEPRQPGFWLSWAEVWVEAESKTYAYRTSGLTVFMGETEDPRKLQLFRAEWAGVLDVIDGAPHYEAQGAGHPHWQFDAATSFARRQEEAAEREHLAALVREVVPLEDFNEDLLTAFELSASAAGTAAPRPAELRWARMHFASLAEWQAKPWDGNPAMSHPHARGPISPREVHNWIASSVRYILRELQR
jgi:hypothetical protein